MRKLTLDETVDRLIALENPAILTHVRPDGDTLGTAAALAGVFSALGKPVVYLANGTIPERLRFLVEGLTRVENTDGYTPVAVDVASPGQLGDLGALVNGGESVALMIDHHAVGIPFTDSYILPEASSAAEVLFGIVSRMEERGLLHLTAEIAYPLYAAISSDTGCFRFSNAKEATYLAAAKLVSLGIDAADINHRLFESKTPSQIAAEGLAATHTVALPDEHIAYALVTRADREAMGLAPWDFETAIDVVRSLAGTDIAFFMRENDDGVFKVSLRSTGPDVATVAAAFGGGGHIRASGCAVEASSIGEAADKLLAVIRETCR